MRATASIASVRELCGSAADFLDGPADKRRMDRDLQPPFGSDPGPYWRVLRDRGHQGVAPALTSETWRFHPCQESGRAHDQGPARFLPSRSWPRWPSGRALHYAPVSRWRFLAGAQVGTAMARQIR